MILPVACGTRLTVKGNEMKVLALERWYFRQIYELNINNETRYEQIQISNR